MYSAICEVFARRCRISDVVGEIYPPRILTIEYCSREDIDSMIDFLGYTDLSDRVPAPVAGMFLSQRCLDALAAPFSPVAAVVAPKVRSRIIPDIASVIRPYVQNDGLIAGWPHGVAGISTDTEYRCGWYRYGVLHRDDGHVAYVSARLDNPVDISRPIGAAAYAGESPLPRFNRPDTSCAIDRCRPQIVYLRDTTLWDDDSLTMIRLLSAALAVETRTGMDWLTSLRRGENERMVIASRGITP